MEKSVEDSITIPEKGPNSKKFGHIYLAFTNYVPFNNQGINVKSFGSMQYEFGRRYKRKLNNTFSVGYNLSFSTYDFNIKQDTAKEFPVSEKFDKEKIRLNALNLELYQRINFGKRGNYMGIFMDVGVRGEWNVFNKYITWDNQVPQAFGRTVKVVYIQPEFISRFSYSLVFRVGFNNVILQCSYSLADIIDQGKYTEDIEGFWIGLQVGLHR